METPSTWRELLATIIAEPQEKQRIASELGIHQITLVRWTTGDGRPRPQLLQKLLASLPAYREQLSLLIAEEFPDFSKSINAGEAETNEIPSAFYSRVFRTIADLSPTLHFWTVCDLILRQLLEQLDPHRLGMFAILAQCMPPSSDGPGRGIYGWSYSRDRQAALRAGFDERSGQISRDRRRLGAQRGDNAHHATWTYCRGFAHIKHAARLFYRQSPFALTAVRGFFYDRFSSRRVLRPG